MAKRDKIKIPRTEEFCKNRRRKKRMRDLKKKKWKQQKEEWIE